MARGFGYGRTLVLDCRAGPRGAGRPANGQRVDGPTLTGPEARPRAAYVAA